jgi:hypothetical protein
MRMVWFLLVVASCGGPAAPPPKTVDNTPPPAFTCANAANILVDQGTPDERLAMRHDLEEACRSDHWPAAYIDCASVKNATCTDSRTPDQIAHANAILHPPRAALPKECEDYIRAIEKLATCDKLPQASRDAMKQGLDAMKSGWDFSNLSPDDYKTAMAAARSACAQGADAVRQGSRAAGCE